LHYLGLKESINFHQKIKLFFSMKKKFEIGIRWWLGRNLATISPVKSANFKNEPGY